MITVVLEKKSLPPLENNIYRLIFGQSTMREGGVVREIEEKWRKEGFQSALEKVREIVEQQTIHGIGIPQNLALIDRFKILQSLTQLQGRE